MEQNMLQDGTAFIFLVFIIIYFLPTVVAWNKKHLAGISILNIFLGWTLLGWIGALIWAVSSPKKQENK